MEKDFRLASWKYWLTVSRLRKGKQGLAQDVFSREGELFMSSVEEAEFEDPWEASLISLAEVSEVVKKLLSGKVPGVDEIALRC